MEAPFLPPVSAGLFWCLVFDVCPTGVKHVWIVPPARRAWSAIPYALETDWLAGAAGSNLCILDRNSPRLSLAGFEPLHLEISSGELHRGSTGWAVGRTPATFFESAAGAPVIRDTQVRVLAPS